jgi:bisphosphoglycerate-dependent phosphoglycerate mutase
MRRPALAAAAMLLLASGIGPGAQAAPQKPEQALKQVEKDLAAGRVRDAELARTAEALEREHKAETAARFGDAQVKIWRRSYDTPPPPLEDGDRRLETDKPTLRRARTGRVPEDRMPEGYRGPLPTLLA